MEKGNEEILKKAVSKDYARQIYKEIRIEYILARLLDQDLAVQAMLDEGYKLNNIIIPGYKDIGLRGQAIFILRKVPKKDGA